MNKGRRFPRKLFLDPRAVVFGISVFTFVWVCADSSEPPLHTYIFMAALLLASSVLILIERAWGNFLAAVLSGYLPVQLAFEFLMTAHRVEVPTLSFRHFAYFAGILVNVEGTVVLFCGLTVLILICSAHSLARLESGSRPPHDA